MTSRSDRASRSAAFRAVGLALLLASGLPAVAAPGQDTPPPEAPADDPPTEEADPPDPSTTPDPPAAPHEAVALPPAAGLETRWDDEGPTGAEDGSVASYLLGRRVPPQPIRLRDSRRAGWAGVGLLGTAAVLVPTAAALRIYDFDGPWFEKAAYDDAFLRRSGVSDAFYVTGISAGVAAVPTLLIAPLSEGVALQRVTDVKMWPGWVGLGLFLGGGASMGTIAFLGPGGAVIAGGIATVGLGFSIAQFALNVRATNRLPQAVQDALYRPKRGVQLSFAPMPLEGGSGLALVGRF